MKTATKIPIINNRFVCVANKDNAELAAVISSYFSDKDTYFPVFIFPNVNASESDVDDFEQDNYISKMIGNEAAVLINNALARVGGCEYLILAGLNEHQKSYVRISKSMKVVEIASVDDVHEKLSQVGISRKGVIECKSKDILVGLHLAQHEGKRLVINEAAEDLQTAPKKKGGLIVVEQKPKDASTVVAVNYAFSVDANLEVVKPLDKPEVHSIQRFIQKWYEDGGNNHFQKIVNKVNQRVGHLNFSDFDYATFFTEGLPYSLIIKNVIPCSYVHLSLRADLFVMNCIVFENTERFNSAVVFSPIEDFIPVDETLWLVDFFRKNNYFLRPLIGEHATVQNLDFHAHHFPYDILHITSHGGEVDGYAVSEEFTDRKGAKHHVEYDEVVGFSPVPGKDLIGVHRKTIFRKFDGFQWTSEELAKQKIPSYVYEDMRKAMYNGKMGQEAKREQKDRVPTSCAIKCYDSIHQGMFRSLASHSSPFVFNSTCWSWYEVAKFFLAGGARGYVGTLWPVRLDIATLAAKTFYENVFGSTILEAFQKMTLAISDTPNKNIFVFWGLHFSTLSTAQDKKDSRHRVFRELVRSLFTWIGHVKETTSKEVKKNSIQVVKEIHGEIVNHFKPEDMTKLETEVEQKMAGMYAEDVTKTEEVSVEIPMETQAVIDHPVKYQKSV